MPRCCLPRDRYRDYGYDTRNAPLRFPLRTIACATVHERSVRCHVQIVSEVASRSQRVAAKAKSGALGVFELRFVAHSWMPLFFSGGVSHTPDASIRKMRTHRKPHRATIPRRAANLAGARASIDCSATAIACCTTRIKTWGVDERDFPSECLSCGCRFATCRRTESSAFARGQKFTPCWCRLQPSARDTGARSTGFIG